MRLRKRADYLDSVHYAALTDVESARPGRIMEKLQVYRARFGGGTRLQIEADLHRGSVE